MWDTECVVCDGILPFWKAPAVAVNILSCAPSRPAELSLTPKLRKNVLESASMLPVYHRLVSLRLDAAEVSF